MNLFLTRFLELPDEGIIGELHGEIAGVKIPLGFTMEQNWRNNEEMISCVPAGTYQLVPYNSRLFGNIYALFNPDLDVYVTAEDCLHPEQRFAVLFAHKGNWNKDFKGCIGNGMDWKLSSTGLMITNTNDACKRLMAFLRSRGNEDHLLHIADATNPHMVKF